jgi:hypothetical protein
VRILYFELCTLAFVCGGPTRDPGTKFKMQRSKFATAARLKIAIPPFLCYKKTDEGRERRTANTLRGTLLLRMATPDTLAKQRRRHPEGSLPSSKDSTRKIAWSFFTNRYFDCQKTKRAGFKPPREAARSLQFSRFFFEIWERESAPAI